MSLLPLYRNEYTSVLVSVREHFSLVCYFMLSTAMLHEGQDRWIGSRASVSAVRLSELAALLLAWWFSAILQH